MDAAVATQFLLTTPDGEQILFQSALRGPTAREASCDRALDKAIVHVEDQAPLRPPAQG